MAIGNRWFLALWVVSNVWLLAKAPRKPQEEPEPAVLAGTRATTR